MKKILNLGLILFIAFISKAQIPTKCVEVESFFVDACGTPEEYNEMMRFRIGPTDMNVSALTITWYSNTFLGICQNATSALKTAAFNRTILGCGFLKEPVAGVLPAGKQILLITSTAVDTLANSFANLNDTLIVIYQCPGATSGHFRNYNSTPLVRYAIINFSGVGGCSDTGTYDPHELVNSLGTHGGGSSVENGATVNFAWNGTPTYVNNGCNAPFVPLIVSIQNNDTTICKYQSLGLSASLNGTNRILWSSSGLGTFNRTDSTSVIFTPSSTALFPINIYAMGFLTCDSTYDTMTINSFADAITVSNDTSHCLADTINLSATGATTYTWSASSGFISCLSCASPTVSSSINASYFLSMTYGLGCVKTDTVSVTILAQDTLNMAQSDTSICAGNRINLLASSNNSYTWTGGTTSYSCTSCANPNILINATTTLAVRSNGVCKVADSIRVTSVAYDNFTLSNDTTICLAQTVLIESFPFVPINWTNSRAYAMGCSLCTSTNIVPADTVAVYAISTGYCPKLDTMYIAVDHYPTITASRDTTICNGASVGLSVSGYSAYTWTSSLGSSSLSCTNCANPIVNPNATTEYYVQTHNRCVDRDTIVVTIRNFPVLTHSADTSVCFGDTVHLFVSGDTAFLWNSPSGVSSLSCTSCQFPNAYTTSNIMYTVQNNSLCVNIDTINITIITPASLVVSADTLICRGETVRLNVGGGSAYAWTSAAGTSSLSCTSCSNPLATPMSSIAYIVSSSAGSSCPSFDTINVTVSNIVKLNAGRDTNICNTQSVSLNTTGASTYLWSSNISPVTLSCLNCANPIATPSATTTYFVSSTDRCTVGDTIRVGVTPYVQITLGNDTQICVGKSVDIVANNGVVYNWTTLPSSSFTCNNCPSINEVVNSTISYVVSDNTPCVLSDTITVIALANPILVSSTDVTISSGQSITINSSGASSYLWIPNSRINNPTSSSPVVNPTENTTYIVMGTSSEGCVSYDTVNVTVVPLNCNLVLPSGFTPNGDGLNDKFGIICNCSITDFNLSIFNRWDDLVFSTNNPSEKWDGSFIGREQGISTFVYSATGIYESKERFNITGTITLIK